MPLPRSGMPDTTAAVFTVGAVEHVLQPKKIAQRGHVAGDRAIAERDQNPGALADHADLAQMIFVRHRAFDQRDVDVFRETP